MSSGTLLVPKEKISFFILDNEYEVTFPNNGQYLEIESMKTRLTGDSYNIISQGVSTSAGLARYTADMIAFFSTCCPKIKKDLKVGSFSELKMKDSKKLLKVYLEVVYPWIIEWERFLNSDDEDEVVEPNKD